MSLAASPTPASTSRDRSPAKAASLSANIGRTTSSRRAGGYQIYAVKAIVDCIDQNCGNGYIWHTTGSGKTLTSFKASTLLKTNESIHKCLFVVDRKDLDRQTREEFNRFQENGVEENTSVPRF
jgi:type I site-specific restriction-modification system R (restriction) subunit